MKSKPPSLPSEASSDAQSRGASTLFKLFTAEEVDAFLRLMSAALVKNFSGQRVRDEDAFLVAADAVRPTFKTDSSVRFEVRQTALVEAYELVKANLCGPDDELAQDFDLRFFRI